MGYKLDPNMERKRHYDAFVVYRDLGYGRSYRATARMVGASLRSICVWAKTYNWKERITQHNAVVAKRKEEGALITTDDPLAQKLADAMAQVEALIKGVFSKDEHGNLVPIIKVKNMEELTKLMAEYRKFLETYHRFVAEYRPLDKEKDRKLNIKEFNINMGDISQDERIKMMKGLMNGNVPNGSKRTPGRVSEANTAEVSERRDEDGRGRDGVSGSAASGGGGNEVPLRKP